MAGTHHVDDSVKHVGEMVDLAIAVLGVLLARAQVQTRTSGCVETHDDLLARLVLGRDVVGCEGIGAIFAAPREGALEALEGIWDLPFGSTKIAEKAFTGQPHALVVGDGLVWGIFECGAREGGPL